MTDLSAILSNHLVDFTEIKILRNVLKYKNIESIIHEIGLYNRFFDTAIIVFFNAAVALKGHTR